LPIANLIAISTYSIGNWQLTIGNIMRPTISHYCQKCLAANPLGQEFCARCGTRLMIIVEPSSLRFESGTAGLSTDEHLLERISAAENRVARLADRLERSLDLLLRYAQNAYFDRSLVRALVNLLSDEGVIETERLEKLWNERCQRDASEQATIHVENHSTEKTAKDAARNQCQGTPGKEASPVKGGPHQRSPSGDGDKKNGKQNTRHEFPPK
jgi:hypothetical protein